MTLAAFLGRPPRVRRPVPALPKHEATAYPKRRSSKLIWMVQAILALCLIPALLVVLLIGVVGFLIIKLIKMTGLTSEDQ